MSYYRKQKDLLCILKKIMKVARMSRKEETCRRQRSLFSGVRQLKEWAAEQDRQPRSCCKTNYLQKQWFKTNSYYFMVSVGRESGQDIIGRVCLRSLPMLWSHLKVQVGQGHHSSSLSRVAAGWRPSSVPSPVGHSTGWITTWQVASIQLSKQWGGEKGCA